MKIHVLAIETKYGTDYSAHATFESALGAAASFARENWSDRGRLSEDGPAPADDNEVLDAFFTDAYDDFYEIAETELEGDGRAVLLTETAYAVLRLLVTSYVLGDGPADTELREVFADEAHTIGSPDVAGDPPERIAQYDAERRESFAKTLGVDPDQLERED